MTTPLTTAARRLRDAQARMFQASRELGEGRGPDDGTLEAAREAAMNEHRDATRAVLAILRPAGVRLAVVDDPAGLGGPFVVVDCSAPHDPHRFHDPSEGNPSNWSRVDCIPLDEAKGAGRLLAAAQPGRGAGGRLSHRAD